MISLGERGERTVFYGSLSKLPLAQIKCNFIKDVNNKKQESLMVRKMYLNWGSWMLSNINLNLKTISVLLV